MRNRRGECLSNRLGQRKDTDLGRHLDQSGRPSTVERRDGGADVQASQGRTEEIMTVVKVVGWHSHLRCDSTMGIGDRGVGF